MIEGREFDASDRSGAVEVSLVNEAFVRRFWPDRRQAVGQHIGVGFPETRTVEVVGVVGDFKNRTLGDVTRPMVFTSILQDPSGLAGRSRWSCDPHPSARRRWSISSTRCAQPIRRCPCSTCNR